VQHDSVSIVAYGSLQFEAFSVCQQQGSVGGEMQNSKRHLPVAGEHFHCHCCIFNRLLMPTGKNSIPSPLAAARCGTWSSMRGAMLSRERVASCYSISHYFALATIGRFCDSEPCLKPTSVFVRSPHVYLRQCFGPRQVPFTPQNKIRSLNVCVDFGFGSLFAICMSQCSNRLSAVLF
jgi:hypothetical protein